METTKNKVKYIKEWLDYIKPLFNLAFIDDAKLSIEVEQTIKKLEFLVLKVADRKDLK